MAAISIESLPTTPDDGATSLRMVNVETNTYKWWRVAWWGERSHMATWGRIGHTPDSGAWTGGQRVAARKVAEKQAKGYKIVADSELRVTQAVKQASGILLLDLEFTTPDRIARLRSLLDAALAAPTPTTLNAFLTEAPIHWHGALSVPDLTRYLNHNRETIRTFLGDMSSQHAQARITGTRTAHIMLEAPTAVSVAVRTVLSPGRQILDDWGD